MCVCVEVGNLEREKQHDGLESMDPRLLTPLFVSECHKRVLDVCVHVCVRVRGEGWGDAGLCDRVSLCINCLN